MKYFLKHMSFAAVKRDSHIMVYNEVHPDIEFYYLKEGERLYFVENRTYHLTAGCSIMIASNRIHKTSSVVGLQSHERMLLEVHPDFLPALSAAYPHVSFDYLLSQTAVITTPDNPYCKVIASIFEEIDRLTREQPFGYEEEVQCNVFKLLLNFHRSLGTADDSPVVLSPKHQKIYEIVEYISANMGEIESLDSLCAHFFISKYYLCHSFKEVTGLSVMAFLNMTRVLRACVLLKEDELSVSQVGKAVGLGSAAHFTDVFKRLEGVTPHEYRRQHNRQPRTKVSADSLPQA